MAASFSHTCMCMGICVHAHVCVWSMPMHAVAMHGVYLCWYMHVCSIHQPRLPICLAVSYAHMHMPHAHTCTHMHLTSARAHTHMHIHTHTCPFAWLVRVSCSGSMADTSKIW